MDDPQKLANEIVKLYADMAKQHDYRHVEAIRFALSQHAFKLAGMVLYDKNDKNNGGIKNG